MRVEKPVAVPGNKAVEEITDYSGDNRKRREDTPAAAKVSEDAQNGRGAQVMPPGFFIDNCVEFIDGKSCFTQHVTALLRLQGHETETVTLVAFFYETHLAVAEIAFTVI